LGASAAFGASLLAMGEDAGAAAGAVDATVPTEAAGVVDSEGELDVVSAGGAAGVVAGAGTLVSASAGVVPVPLLSGISVKLVPRR